ncbi:MAG TPA: hypothetical protein VL547_13225 [Dinghuibacter sp.]|uniref:hypothetical protein n=1 Tax=Dinghuibacter sp. TaxID=2024697 RepID=UPI002BA1CDE7|nr:hypothetical protein [Dinghuibacter sp.]HTJ12990.1 hypothetical protein [Dinghuibacter sp.]
MLHQLIAVVAPKTIDNRTLTQAVAAIQKQVDRDVFPLWQVRTSISVFTDPKDVPVGYWPVTLVEQTTGDLGFHQDEHGQPSSIVELRGDWTVTLSHECIEMLVDPYGNRMVPGDSPVTAQGRVNFLVEVCDPCQGCSYTVNGIKVSDFYTPNYFDPVRVQGTRYSYTGSIQAPREVLKGGYLSWMTPATGDWWQRVNQTGVTEDKAVTSRKGKGMSNRQFIDTYVQDHHRRNR